MRSLLRAALGAVLTAGTMATGIVTTTTTASAATPTTIRPDTWARIDSRVPADTITSGDALVGAYRDDAGKHHLTKSYFTFDLTSLHGREVFSAAFVAPQLAAADCDSEVAVELWRTDPAPEPTWADQPAELARLASPNQLGCPTGQLGWNVADTIATAVADGLESITLGLRVSEDHQGDIAYGRTFHTAPYLRLTSNAPPNPPANLYVDRHTCAEADIVTAPWYGSGVPLRGEASDPDGTASLQARAQVWDVDNPSDVYEVVTHAFNGTFSLTYPDWLATDGATYQWRARAEDRDDAVSAWSAPCEFTVDRTRPDVPPTVHSDYFVEDSGPPGVTGPGEFTFTANGVADVVGYRWSGIGIPYGSVRADQPGGPATVTIMPTSDGPASISVVSFDAAGNPSAERTYRFWVASNAPTTSFADQHYFGERVPVTLTATQEGAATFTYVWEPEEGQPEHTVPVGADGTASVVVDMPTSGPTAYEFKVWTTTADGRRSQVNANLVYINDTAPWVYLSAWEVAVGETITATIDPVFLGDVMTYRWRVDDGPEHTITPDADDTAQFTYVPTEPGTHTLVVYATYANGGFSDSNRLDVTVS